jgi:hypothetical protein
MTKTPLVHDMYVESTTSIVQFGLYQASPVPVTHTINTPCTSKFIANFFGFCL